VIASIGNTANSQNVCIWRTVLMPKKSLPGSEFRNPRRRGGGIVLQRIRIYIIRFQKSGLRWTVRMSIWSKFWNAIMAVSGQNCEAYHDVSRFYSNHSWRISIKHAWPYL